MAAQKKIELFYKEIDQGLYSTVKHYQLIKPDRPNPLLGELLNIQDARGYSKSKPIYWVKSRFKNKWSKPLTGLFKTSIDHYHLSGDIDEKRHLVIFEFTITRHRLKVTIFPNYYPFDRMLHPMTVAKRINSTNI